MAKSKSKPKSKKVLDEEDKPVEQAAEEADAEVADVDVDINADVDAVADVDADADDEPPQASSIRSGDDDEGDQLSVDDAPKAPRPTLTWATWILIGLNLLAAPVVLFLLKEVHLTHEQYNYRTILNFVRVWGLPLKSEETPTSISTETRPTVRLNAEQLKLAFSSRKPGFSLPGSEPKTAVSCS